MTKRILILSVFVVASCGLAYELIAGALSSYLLGDSVYQFSLVIPSMLRVNVSVAGAPSRRNCTVPAPYPVLWA